MYLIGYKYVNYFFISYIGMLTIEYYIGKSHIYTTQTNFIIVLLCIINYELIVIIIIII